MTMPRSEHPSDRSTARWVLDVVVATLAGASALPYLFRDVHGPHALAALVLLVVVAPLVVRRRWPLPVFGWVLVTAIAAGLWNDHVIAGLAVLVALYAVAAFRPRTEALGAACLVEIALVSAAFRGRHGSWWFDAIFLTGMVVAALGLGLYSATRCAYLEELRDRAARMERERDQQGALSTAAERARIAREMHDIVAHHLTVMVALSDGAIAASATSPQQAAEVMRTVSATGRRALADTRRVLGVLSRDSVDGVDAFQPVPDLAQLEVLVDRVRSAGLATTFVVQGAAGEVPAGVQLTVYRLVQEALTNTLKHGGPNARASVRLRYAPGELLVDVHDDGAGSAAPIPAVVGAGLLGMQERVHAYGGDVTSGPDGPRGWRVSARLGLDDLDHQTVA